MNNDKIGITIKLGTLEFEGRVEDLITELQNKMAEKKEEGFFDLFVEKETDYYGCRDGYDYFQLRGTRLETDEELAKRIADNERRSKAGKLAAKTKAINRVKRERKQYLKLHAKYGKD